MRFGATWGRRSTTPSFRAASGCPKRRATASRSPSTRPTPRAHAAYGAFAREFRPGSGWRGHGGMGGNDHAAGNDAASPTRPQREPVPVMAKQPAKQSVGAH